MNRIDRYIQDILAHTECSNQERYELFEEFRSHLEAAKEDYMDQGFSPKKAEQLAIRDFGEDENVGDQLQETMYPYRKDCMFFVGFGTIVFGTFTYLDYTSKFAQPPFIWMIVILLLGAVVTLFGLNLSFAANKKVLVNSVLGGLNIFYLSGLFLILDSFSGWSVTLLRVLDGLLIVVSLIMVFLTALKPSTNAKKVKGRKTIHIFNLVIGIVILGWALVLTFVGLMFVGIDLFLLLPLGIAVVWALSYWAQYKFISNRRWIAISFGGLSAALPVFILGLYSF